MSMEHSWSFEMKAILIIRIKYKLSIYLFLLGSLLFKTVIWMGYNIGDFFFAKKMSNMY